MGGEQLSLQLAQLAALLRQRALHRLALRPDLAQKLRRSVAFRLEGVEQLCSVADGRLTGLLGEGGGFLAGGLQRQVFLPARLDRRVEGIPRFRQLLLLLSEPYVPKGEVRLQALQGLPHEAKGGLATPHAPVPVTEHQVSA